ncbi:unnamed protein product [Closterium sp. Naga37s-1]|nr:unnamed protein product [Closterium sp. Naga37s-1]
MNVAYEITTAFSALNLLLPWAHPTIPSYATSSSFSAFSSSTSSSPFLVSFSLYFCPQYTFCLRFLFFSLHSTYPNPLALRCSPSALFPELARQEAACNAFCGVSSAVGVAAACGGHGVCYPEGSSLAPTCLCDAEFVRFGEIGCAPQGQQKNYSTSQPILPQASVLTKGTQRETRGSFTTAPVMLFAYEAGQMALGAGVGYGGMDKRSVAVEFDTLQNKEHGDMSSPHLWLNVRGEDISMAAVRSPFPLSNRKAYTAWVDYEPGDPGTILVFLADSQEKSQQAVLERRLALCEVLQGAAEQPAFFFGFVASTTVKPFQRHVILESAVDTGKQCALLGR